MTLFRGVFRRRRFARDARGAVAIVFSLALIPVMALLGAAIDYASLSSRRVQIRDAVDFAALSAAAAASAAVEAGGTTWQADALKAARDSLSVNLKGADANGLAVVATQQGSTITAQVSYTEVAATTFMKIVGVRAVTLAVSSEAVKGAAAASANYVDLHIVMDVSAAMGIGATAADQSLTAGAASTLNCALACHTKSVHYLPTDSDTLARAQALGAQTRIATLRKAVQDALAAAQATAKGNQLRVALYAMSNTLSTVHPLSAGLPGAATAAGAVEVTGAIGQGGSNISYALTQLNDLVATSGDGSSQKAAKQIVLLAASGVQNSNRIIACTSAATLDSRCTGANRSTTTTQKDPNWLGDYAPFQSFPAIAGNPVLQSIDPSYCAPLKAKGARVMTLTAEYVVPTVGGGLNDARLDFVTSLLPRVKANMAACASSAADARYARDAADIDKAIAAMVASAAPAPAQALHLTR